MTTNEVAVISGKSPSLINKVRAGETKGLSTETVNKIKFLLALEVNYLDALFAKPDFSDICSEVLNKASERSHKNMVEIVRFTNKCLRRHRSLVAEENHDSLEAEEMKASDIMGIYLADTKTLFKNDLFPEFCTLAIKLIKDEKLRAYADFLMDISEMLRALDKKKSRKKESDENGKAE